MRGKVGRVEGVKKVEEEKKAGRKETEPTHSI
jgi:hypothetical protein